MAASASEGSIHRELELGHWLAWLATISRMCAAYWYQVQFLSFSLRSKVWLPGTAEIMGECERVSGPGVQSMSNMSHLKACLSQWSNTYQ